MNTRDISLPVEVETYDGLQTIDVVLDPSYVTLLYTSGDFYRNFIKHHDLNLEPLSACPVCSGEKCTGIDPSKITIKAKMWNPFPWGIYVRCENCDAIFQNVLPPKELLNFLYTYCYPNTESQSPRLFEAFDIEEKIIKEDVLDLGGGPGSLRKFVRGRYVNADVSPESDIRLNIDDPVEEKKIIRKIGQTFFDTVVCCDLIEHVLNPSNIFKISKIILKSKGKVYLNVGQVHNENEIRDFHPPHLISFSDKTIDFLADRFGFEVLERHDGSYILEKN